jgi:Na+:H+ antiporter, NhaA family
VRDGKVAGDGNGGRAADEAPLQVRIRPLVDFLHTEAAGGVVLLAATLVALVLANSPWSEAYEMFWHTPVAIEVGPLNLGFDLRELVNDGLMAIFFLVVGLEIKRELVDGELRGARKAALPAIAAVGGMVVPAALYLLLNAGGAGAQGWGIPMATDIAMAVGVLSLLGSRVPSSLKLFLLALAIVDDIGAIVVIALFYGGGIDSAPLLGAAGAVALVLVMRSGGLQAMTAYVLVGAALWFFLYEAGIHPTIAGVILGLLAPTRPARHSEMIDASELTDLSSPQAARETVAAARQSVSVVEWLEHGLHPWTSFVVLPIFALANAGIPLRGAALDAAAGSPITLGVILGLVVGKTVGITGFAWLAVRVRAAELPEGATWPSLAGVAAVAGIGFTVAIFIAGLAFEDPALQDLAKIGILAGSLISAVLGALILRRMTSARQGSAPEAEAASARGHPGD